MNSVFLYLVKVNIVFSILFLVYRFLFHNRSYLKVNRFVLLFIVLFSLACPVLKFQIQTGYEIVDITSMLNDFYEPAMLQENMPNDTQGNKLAMSDFIFIVYLLGALLFFLRFVNQFRFIFKLRYDDSIVRTKHQQIHYLNKKFAPFSFFKWIFIPKHIYEESELEAILIHEKVHVKQIHSLDLIFAEIFCIISWFNPFVFLFKKSLKNLHEFLADREVIKNHFPVEGYLKLLFSSVEMQVFSRMASNFKLLNFKNRIKMITNNKKSKIGQLIYLIFIPILLVIVFAFSPDNQNSIDYISQINQDNETQKEETLPDLSKNEAKLSSMPSICPIKKTDYNRISSGYGYRLHPVKRDKRLHSGIDFAAKEGVTIMATADGKVIKAEYEKEIGHGKMILIQHDNTYSSFYSHLSEIKVKEGDNVKKGDVIGLVGNTGKSTGPHLHYEVWKNGEKVDPKNYFPKNNNTK